MRSLISAIQCVLLLECILLLSVGYCGGIGCRDNEGNPVDWFIVYKLPKLPSSSNLLVKNGVGQAYMDVNGQKWTMLDHSINDSSHAIYHTLLQIYNSKASENVAYLLYNDEIPKAKPGNFRNSRGHTKGSIAFDQSTGFWLVHSVPKFPPPQGDGYKYPWTGTIYGQTFLCMTLNYKTFNDVGKQLKYNNPRIYDKTLPAAFQEQLPDMADVILSGKHVQQPPWNSTVTLSSSGGQQFISFAKYDKFDQDLYHEWVAPYLDSDLLVETWQNGEGGKLSSNCTQHKVLNIQSLQVANEVFPSKDDHSKWAVTTSGAIRRSTSDWICIGDINRMNSQWKRAGGTVCGSIAHVWESFNSSITGTEKCDQLKIPRKPLHLRP